MKVLSFKTRNEKFSHIEFFLSEKNKQVTLGVRNTENKYEHTDCVSRLYIHPERGCVASMGNKAVNKKLFGINDTLGVTLTKGAVEEYKNEKEVMEINIASRIQKEKQIELGNLDPTTSLRLSRYVTGYGTSYNVKTKELKHNHDFLDRALGYLHKENLIKLSRDENNWDSNDSFGEMTWGEFNFLIKKHYTPYRNAQKEKNERIRKEKGERDEKIKAGEIFMVCDSQPTTIPEGTILNRPASSNGIYRLTHRVSSEFWNRYIKPYATYWNREFLEDCDMFMSEPGWRISGKAIEAMKNDSIIVNIENHG